MVTDEQVRLLFKYDTEGFSKEVAAAKAGMNEKTARKFRRFSKLPSEVSRMDRSWRTRPDPFVKVWPELQELLIVNPGLQAATLMQHLQRTYPNSFEQGQLRTLQRRIKQWRAEHGSAQEVFFEQVHHPGRICASDFTYCNDLGVTINGQPFDHMIYHFVLTYSNWETGNICYSESFESLSEGLQDALWELGGVPQVHRTDSLTAAVPPGVKDASEEFRQRYQGLLKHYGLQGQRINVRQAHENGDCEQRHHRLKVAIRQALMLRGSKDFASREQYAEFLKEVFQQLNASRTELVREEARQLKPLPATRLEACRRLRVRVDRGSTIHIDKNTYSLHSRLIGEQVEARVYATSIEIWYWTKEGR